jgi:hypothetical protein
MHRHALLALALAGALGSAGTGCAPRREVLVERVGPEAASAARDARVPAAVLGAVAAFNAHDPAGLADRYAESAVVGGPGRRGWSEERGRAPLIEGHKKLFAGFPDLRMEPVRFIVGPSGLGDGQGPVLLQEWVTRGHALGEPIGGSEQRGQGPPVALRVATLLWIGPDGLVARDHTYIDGVELGIQTGKRKGTARRELASGAPRVVLATGDAGEANRTLRARELYAAIEQRRWRTVEGLLAGAERWRRPGAGRDWKGAVAMAQGLRVEAERHRTRQVVVQHIVAAGPYVVAELAEPSLQRSGADARVRHRVDVIRFAPDGHIAALRTYADRSEP